MKVRIQKLLSSSGIASRRTIEKWIKKNRLIVDGKFAKIGQIVSGSEKFQLDGDLLAVKLHHTNHKLMKYLLDPIQIKDLVYLIIYQKLKIAAGYR